MSSEMKQTKWATFSSPITSSSGNAAVSTTSKPDDQIASCCRWLTAILKWMSFNVVLDAAERSRPSTLNVCYTGALHGLLVVIYLRFLVEYLFGIYETIESLLRSSNIEIQLLFFPEPLIGLVLLVSFRRNRLTVIDTLIEIIDKTLRRDPTRSTAFRSIRRCSNALAVLIAALAVINTGLAVYFTKFMDGVHTPTFNDFLHLVMPSKRVRAVEQVIAMFTYNSFLVTSIDIFCLFQIFVFYLLYQCYRQLNAAARLKPRCSCRDLYDLQVDHKDVTRLVNLINRLFSPSIFIFTVFSVVKMTAGLKSLMDLSGALSVHFCTYYVVNVSRIILLFGGTSLMASRVYLEARTSVDIMQAICVKDPSCCTARRKPIREQDFKECHTINLFVTQMTLNPVGISAFDMFTINYGLIVIVISTIATYLSAISSMDAANWNSESPFSE